MSRKIPIETYLPENNSIASNTWSSLARIVILDILNPLMNNDVSKWSDIL